jgi:hypothetical protein
MQGIFDGNSTQIFNRETLEIHERGREIWPQRTQRAQRFFEKWQARILVRWSCGGRERESGNFSIFLCDLCDLFLVRSGPASAYFAWFAVNLPFRPRSFFGSLRSFAANIRLLSFWLSVNPGKGFQPS